MSFELDLFEISPKTKSASNGLLSISTAEMFYISHLPAGVNVLLKKQRGKSAQRVTGVFKRPQHSDGFLYIARFSRRSA